MLLTAAFIVAVIWQYLIGTWISLISPNLSYITSHWSLSNHGSWGTLVVLVAGGAPGGFHAAKCPFGLRSGVLAV